MRAKFLTIIENTSVDTLVCLRPSLDVLSFLIYSFYRRSAESSCSHLGSWAACTPPCQGEAA